MVGGRIIEIAPVKYGVSRLWCADRYGNECAVHVEDAPAMPLVGDEIWGQSGKVYWDRDRRALKKFGNSYDLGRLGYLE